MKEREMKGRGQRREGRGREEVDERESEGRERGDTLLKIKTRKTFENHTFIPTGKCLRDRRYLSQVRKERRERGEEEKKVMCHTEIKQKRLHVH